MLGTGLSLAAAWSTFFMLRQRERFLTSVLRLQEAAPTFEDFESQARALCEACSRETNAMGTTLYLQPGRGETGFRRAAQVGQSAEETGPGVVRDLLTQAWESGKPTESSYSGRFIMAVPVWPGHEGGGALLLFWEESKKPGAGQRRLVEVVSSIASLMLVVRNVSNLPVEVATPRRTTGGVDVDGHGRSSRWLTGGGRRAGGGVQGRPRPLSPSYTR